MKQLELNGETGFYQGKVRDVYYINEDLLVMVASNRLSAFDVILPEPIPFKGQVLTQLASYMMQACSDICPIWLLSTPAPNVSIGYQCNPVKLEMVVRGNLTGHAWRTYKSGARKLCGVSLPEGMKEYDFFDEPIITPSTKANEGHDMDISEAEIINQQLTSTEDWQTLKSYSLKLFKRGQEMAAECGLILADTKYEFGKRGDTIYLIDEIHTPDSSRYFIKEGFKEKLMKGEKQIQLSKEFVREWLMANGFMGKENQQVPFMSKEKVEEISRRYILLFERLSHQRFSPWDIENGELSILINEEIKILYANLINVE